MANDLQMFQSGQKIPFFKKPGSIAGTVLLAVGAGFLLWNAVPILTWLNSLLASTITTIGLVVALAALMYVIFDPKVRTIVSELYFLIVRKVLGIVVEMDPIAIVKHHIEKMKDKIAEIQKNKGSLRGLINDSKRHIAEKKEKLEHDMLALKKCQEMLANPHLTQQARTKVQQEASVYEHSVTRLQGIIARGEERIRQSEKWYRILEDLAYTAELTVRDTEAEVAERVEEWNIIKKQNKVFTSVVSILSKEDRVGAFTMAMDYMSYDITQKLGDMESVIEATGSIISSYSMDNAITSDKAQRLLEKYEQGGIDAILNNMHKPEPEYAYAEEVHDTPQAPKQIEKSWFD